ncbi:MAG: hypothetical protein ACRDZ5_03480, partial [Acidimicrobiales bacterium]
MTRGGAGAPDGAGGIVEASGTGGPDSSRQAGAGTLPRDGSKARRTVLGRIATAMTVSAACALLLAGCTATTKASTPSSPAGPAGPAGSPLSARKADAIARSTMATNNRANAKLDNRLLESYETDSALQIDAAQYHAERLSGSRAASTPFSIHIRQTVLEAGARPSAFAVVGESYLLGRKPASEPCPNSDSVLVFERSGDNNAYKIALEPSSDHLGIPQVSTGRGDVAVPLTSSLAKAARAMPSRLATALERYEASGVLGGLSKSDFSGSCWALPDPRVELQSVGRSGLEERQLFKPVGLMVTFQLRNGLALVMFTLSSEETIVSASPGAFVDWRHVRGDPTTYFLASGHYSKVTERTDIEVVATLGEPPGPSGPRDSVGSTTGQTTGHTGARPGYRVIGAYEGALAVTGTRISAGSGGELTGELTRAAVAR